MSASNSTETMVDCVPDGWVKKLFGDVANLSKEKSKNPIGDSINRFIGLEHIEPYDLKVQSWGDTAEGTTFTSVCRPGQVLFGKRRAYLRKLAVADFTAVCSGDIYIFEAVKELIDPNYLTYLCFSDLFFDYAIKTSAGSLSPRTNWKHLAEYEFVLPPMDVQKRIVTIVEAVNDHLDALEKALEKTRTVRSTTLEELLWNPGDDWQSTTLGEVADVVSDRVDPTAISETHYVGLEHLVTDQRRLLSWGSTADVSSSTTPFCPGDTLFGRLRPYLRKGCLVEFEGVCTPEILVVRTRGSVDEQFIGLLALNDRTFDECTRLSAGTRMPRISAKDFKALSVSIPPFSEQRRIADLVGSIDEQVAGLELQIETVKELRQALLSDLLSGSREIPESFDELEMTV